MTRHLFARGVTAAVWLGLSAAMLAQSGSFTYDPSAEVTVSGKVLHSFGLPAPDGTMGLHIDLSTPAGMLNVHVAPATYIAEQNFWFYADDQLEITGVKEFLDGNRSFIARSVIKGGKTLTLRGADGKVAWTPAVEGIDGCGVAHAALPRGTER